MYEILINTQEYIVNNLHEVIGYAVTIIAGSFALYQWRVSILNSRAKYVKDLLYSITGDESIQKFQRYTDYGEKWYTKDFHDCKQCDKNDIQTIADKTMFTYNYICYLYDTNVINKKELEIFTYYMLVLAQDKELAFYFLDLYQYSIHKEGSYKLFPFEHYLDFCIKNKCLDESIKDERFFYYYLQTESNKNEGVNANEVPKEIAKLISLVEGRLLIKTVSRCRNCSNYSDGKCRLNKNTDEFYWVGRGNECDGFVFPKGTTAKTVKYGE